LQKVKGQDRQPRGQIDILDTYTGEMFVSTVWRRRLFSTIKIFPIFATKLRSIKYRNC